MDRAIKLTWRERIGYCSGELAQNLIYQTVSIWLLFYYTNVYGLQPRVAAVMFLVVRIIDVLWDPFVGTFVDHSYPRWGKYRSWLIFGGIPLTGAVYFLHHHFRHDEHQQRRRLLLPDIRSRSEPAKHVHIHVAWHHTGFHLHTAGPCHETENGEEGAVQCLHRRLDTGNGRMAEINGIVESRHRADTI